ncbi:hypothetical protein CBFG_01960 [Clostridiales bacterium 1_7_47FAA]|uniref:Rhomboid family intramembrane serine protease n=1 Tax=Enterocloster hominis (ex Hitch et al. 2024) TaxID=1917870 RepID=A0ABV1D8A9_9FIRM|nr:hypothetical protein CBFG_01960 [Clostridiales bacterium 1_7_47FAA]
MNFLKKFEQKMNRFAIGGIINYVCAMLAMGTVLYLVAPGFLNYLILNPIAIMQGQVWRILTFFVYPPAFTGGNPMGYILFNALAIYCIRSFGTIVEQVWGKFRFNCYIILGVLLNVAASLFMYLVVGFPMVLTPVYLVYSFFFVFALMFPDMQVLLMMVLPLKAKWIAYAEAAVYIYYFVKGDIYTRVQIFVCILHMFIFFGWMVLAGETGYKQKKRQKDFQKKIKPMVSNKTGHKCAVCGRTDKDSPGMEFRYCSKCEGSYEYCMDHLYTHQHVKKPDSPQ